MNDPPGLNNSEAAALSVSQAHYLIDKLLCVCGCIGVVLPIGARRVMFRKYFCSPVQKSWFRFCRMGN